MIGLFFGSEKPIIGMVHLQYKGNLNRLVDEAIRDVGCLERGGADGLLFENWGKEYTGRCITPETREYITVAMDAAARTTTLPYGVNVLPLDYEAAFDIAKRTGARFVHIDTFVDTVRTDYDSRFVINIRPRDVIEYRRKSDLYYLHLFTNIQTKHYKTIPPNKKLETSAIQAVQNGTDAIVVTGKSTGKKTPKGKILAVKRVCGDVPVIVGSGVTAANVMEIAPYVDGFIVGTGIKVDGVTENPVDEERLKRLKDAVDHRLRT